MKEYFLGLPESEVGTSRERRIDIAREDIKIIQDFDRSIRKSGGKVNDLKTVPEVVAFATLGLCRVMGSREVREGLSRKTLKTSKRLIETYSPKASATISEVLKTKNKE